MTDQNGQPQRMGIPLFSEGDTMRIERIRIYPWPDLTKLWVRIDLAFARAHPNVEVLVFGPDGAEHSSMYLLEVREPNVDVNMHLRKEPQPDSTYRAEVVLSSGLGEEQTVVQREMLEFPLTFVDPRHS